MREQAQISPDSPWPFDLFSYLQVLSHGLEPSYKLAVILLLLHSALHSFGFLFVFFPCCIACMILVPQLGIELGLLAGKVQSPNH